MTDTSPIAMVTPLTHGIMADFSDTSHPSKVYGFTKGAAHLKASDNTYDTVYGCVYSGTLRVSGGARVYEVHEGEYFCMPYGPEGVLLDGVNKETGTGEAEAILAVRMGFRGISCMGGPVESVGRLKYIDGCSDTLLIGPPLLGDPCQNFLRFPPNIEQTLHTHPTIRAGVILTGKGVCRTAHGDKDLRPGDAFILYPDAVHGFSTAGTEGMTLSVFHPDTDTGPSHEDHPMLNRTIVGGVSAAKLDNIRTREIT